MLAMFAGPFLVGCPKAPLSYKLQQSGTTAILIPPNVHSTDEKAPQLIKGPAGGRFVRGGASPQSVTRRRGHGFGIFRSELLIIRILLAQFVEQSLR